MEKKFKVHREKFFIKFHEMFNPLNKNVQSDELL